MSKYLPNCTNEPTFLASFYSGIKIIMMNAVKKWEEICNSTIDVLEHFFCVIYAQITFFYVTYNSKWVHKFIFINDIIDQNESPEKKWCFKGKSTITFSHSILCNNVHLSFLTHININLKSHTSMSSFSSFLYTCIRSKQLFFYQTPVYGFVGIAKH